MKSLRVFPFEMALLLGTAVLAVAGFWNVFFGQRSNPNPYHYLHLIANFTWLFLLFFQLNLIANRNHRLHRRAGLSVLFAAPLLVASVAMLAVHSAHKGILSGQGDALIVQNVMGTFELALLIVSAFALRKNRKLHGSFLLATAILFMGIALFFTLISFIPGFKIEGPDTFYRFETAGTTGNIACIAVGLLFFLKDYRNGWPLLLAGSFFSLNSVVGSMLARRGLIDPLTAIVGSMHQPLTFISALLVTSGMLVATGMLRSKTRPLETDTPGQRATG